MFIIIKTDLLSHEEEIIDVIYGEEYDYAVNIIEKYYNDLIVNLKNDTKFEYIVEIKNTDFFLIKKYTNVTKGYIYNKSSLKLESISSIKIKEFNENKMRINLNKSQLWANINSEINKRIIKNMDKESLYQFRNKFNDIINTNNTWTNTSLVMLENKLVKEFKKELFTSIVKKDLKKPIHPVQYKTIILNDNGKMIKYKECVPNLSKCLIQYSDYKDKI